MRPQMGIIEGYYGQPWQWRERAETVAFLAPHRYTFYIYAPKSDEFLRRRWREPHPPEIAQQLTGLSYHCRHLGMSFGFGLSPYEIYLAFDDEAKGFLAAKLRSLDNFGLEILAILFDDMRGDVPELAETQADIVHWIAERTSARQILVCPTYYSDDPVLDRVFGRRPEHYLENLGRLLDPKIDAFWTGEEVCAREFSPGHLQRVAGQLRRKPFLWDNYPVNDGARMSQFLHLRAFTGRPASIADCIAAHAINPALQPVLSRIPALTLAESYERGEQYEYSAAFLRAAEAVLGAELAVMVRNDLNAFQDIGLEQLGDRAGKLRTRYAKVDHPGAREIVAWLDGAYRFAGEMH